LPQLLAAADLKRFFRAIRDCGDVQHEILLKLLILKSISCVYTWRVRRSLFTRSVPLRSSGKE
jgi:hypothetical protein